MYSLRWSYRKVRRRLDELGSVMYASEAYLLIVFMIEKILRRTLLHLIIASGRSMDEALEVSRKIPGLASIDKHWAKHDSQKRKLSQVLGETIWEVISDAAQERNRLVHGQGHYQEKHYKKKLRQLLSSLDMLRAILSREYGFSGWKGLDLRDRAKLLDLSDAEAARQALSESGKRIPYERARQALGLQ